jgi:glycosyltransferase involved in cell wall biosynthesis
MYKNKKISVVIPAYNEENLIDYTLRSLPEYLDKIYVIDDSSQDNTFKLISELASKRSEIIPIKHVVNRGVGASIVTGYKRSLEDGNDIAVVMGGDNQMDPKYIPSLIEPIIEEKADYTKGNRLQKAGYAKGMSSWRFMGNSILSFLTKISSGYWNIYDPQNGYTAISRKSLETIDLDSIYERYGYCNDMLVKLNVGGFRVLDVPIPAKYENEKSKIVYHKYIFSVSFLLLRNFLWRINARHIANRFNIVGFIYLIGLSFIPSSLILEVLFNYFKIVLYKSFLSVVPSIIFAMSFLILAIAIIIDTRINGRH